MIAEPTPDLIGGIWRALSLQAGYNAALVGLGVLPRWAHRPVRWGRFCRCAVGR